MSKRIDVNELIEHRCVGRPELGPIFSSGLAGLMGALLSGPHRRLAGAMPNVIALMRSLLQAEPVGSRRFSPLDRGWV